MRTKKLFIAIPAAALLLLAGCQAGQVVTTSEQVNPGANSLPTTNQTASSSGQYSAADQAAYAGAQQLKDPSFCEKISDENYKKACSNAVNDQGALETAITKIDASLCAKLSTADQQKACNVRVEVLLKEKENSKKHEEVRKNTGTLRDQFVKAGDYKRCQELKIEGYVSECEVNILSQKAISAKDISWCKKASTEGNQKNCAAITNKTLGKN